MLTRDLIFEGASRTELTYFELIRVFGIPFGVFIISYLLYIASRMDNDTKIATIIILFQSFLNPYLFSSNGMLAIGLFNKFKSK